MLMMCIEGARKGVEERTAGGRSRVTPAAAIATMVVQRGVAGRRTLAWGFAPVRLLWLALCIASAQDAPGSAGPGGKLACQSLRSPSVITISNESLYALNFTTADYKAGLDCGWMVVNGRECESGNPQLKLSWVGIDIEFWYDYVLIYDGATEADKRIGSFSGNSFPKENIVSSGARLLLHFHSDLDKSGLDQLYEGFRMDLAAVCGPPKDAPDPNCHPISAPLELRGAGALNFTAASYGHNRKCAWLFRNMDTTCSEPNMELFFALFSTEQSYDYVTLYKGSVETREMIIGRYSGPNIFDGPGYHRTEGNGEVLVVFESDGGNTGNFEGFSLTYKAVCGRRKFANCPSADTPQVLNGLTKTLTPGFFVYASEHYENMQNCNWLFTNPNTTCSNSDPIVLLSFPHFNTEKDYDLLTLYDGPTRQASVLGGRSYSGFGPEDRPGFQASTTAQVLLTFETDRNLVFGGFTVEYEFKCASEKDSAPSGTCPGLGKPEARPAAGDFRLQKKHYENNLDCAWIFTNTRTDCPTGTGPVVGMDFARFDTEAVFDYIGIYDEDETRDDFHGLHYSGSRSWEVPKYVRSKTATVELRFHSDGSVNVTEGDDTILAHVTSECSGDPLPLSSWDCTEDQFETYVRVMANPTSPQILYGHYAPPFTVGRPIAAEQAYDKPRPESMLRALGPKGVTASLVFARDQLTEKSPDRTSRTMFCCAELDPALNVTGKIVVCDRGQCSFTTKSRVAQAHGAVALVVIDYDENGLLMSSAGDHVDDITIPSISVRNSFGAMLWQVAEQTNISLKIGSFFCHTSAPTPLPTQAPTEQRSSHMGAASRMYLLLLATPTFVQEKSEKVCSSLENLLGFETGSVLLVSATAARSEEGQVGTRIAIDVYGDARGAIKAHEKVLVAKERFASGSPVRLLGNVLAQNFSLTAPSPCVLSTKERTCITTALSAVHWEACQCRHHATGLGVTLYVLLTLLLQLLLFACCRGRVSHYLRKRWSGKRGRPKAPVDLGGVEMSDIGVQEVVDQGYAATGGRVGHEEWERVSQAEDEREPVSYSAEVSQVEGESERSHSDGLDPDSLRADD